MFMLLACTSIGVRLFRVQSELTWYMLEESQKRIEERPAVLPIQFDTYLLGSPTSLTDQSHNGGVALMHLSKLFCVICYHPFSFIEQHFSDPDKACSTLMRYQLVCVDRLSCSGLGKASDVLPLWTRWRLLFLKVETHNIQCQQTYCHTRGILNSNKIYI